jgi:hypothetical protein
VTAQTHTNVIELHPQAVQRFKDNIEALAKILSDKDGLPDLEIAGTFRSLVESVVVEPRKAGEEYVVNIRGYLASLMGVEPSALLMVAERLCMSTYVREVQPGRRGIAVWHFGFDRQSFDACTMYSAIATILKGGRQNPHLQSAAFSHHQ